VHPLRGSVRLPGAHQVNLAHAAAQLADPACVAASFGAPDFFRHCFDNAPTYAAFAALARGLSHGQPDLVPASRPSKLAAVSIGSVVMGATTYIGNGPNLMVKAIAERAG